MMKRFRFGRVAAILVAAMLAVAVPAGWPVGASSAEVAGRWAKADRATIRPGVQMYTKGAQCTGNFVFTDAADRVYVGYAAHCAGTGEPTDVNGCNSGSHPLGTRVRFASDGSLVSGGETVGRGRLVYSSWLAMQRLGTTNRNACDYNDFALVRVGRAHVDKVNPTVPYWGGPVALGKDGTDAGEEVYSYGSSGLRADVTALSPKTGTSLGDTAGGWSHTVYTATPGIPGDSGSAFLDSRGRAVGTLSTITIAPLAGSNGVSDLAHELSFARRHSGIDGLRLVPGTKSFSALL